LSSGTTYVTLSVGGNDAGFSGVITECAKPGWASNCDGKINTAQSYINNTLPGSLSTLYASIRSKAPSAKVVIVGYPRLFQGEDCNAGTWFSPTEESRLNQTADLLNSKVAAAASAKGFTFANQTSRFFGHAVEAGQAEVAREVAVGGEEVVEVGTHVAEASRAARPCDGDVRHNT
jgi:hypothetical protein